MKKILLAALVASSLFACNKKEVTDQEDLQGQQAVTLSIQQDAMTKGISDQVGNPEYSVVGSARIYFINSSGNSIYQRELTSAEIIALANTSTTPGPKTITITGVPNTATSLYFMANIKTTDGSTYPAVDGTTSADARLRLDKLQVSVAQAPMSGLSTTFTPAGASHVTAAVELTPIVARLELGKVSYKTSTPIISSDITGYKLAGVFINNVRGSVMLSGSPYLSNSPIDIKAQAGWATGWDNYFASTNSVFPYFGGGSVTVPSDWVANSFVNHCVPTTSALVFYPDPTTGATSTDPAVTPKRAWAYQVAPSTTAAVGTPADVPHIILKLIDVVYQNNDLGKPIQYVTITKYKKTDGTPITAFERGNVYRIDDLVFTYNEATNEPYQQNITVEATVTVKPWVLNNIVPDWN